MMPQGMMRLGSAKDGHEDLPPQAILGRDRVDWPQPSKQREAQGKNEILTWTNN